MSKRIIIYGPSKIGISFFLSKAPDSIFINAGNGLKHLNCKTIKDSTSFASIMDSIQKMIKIDKAKFPYKNIIVDHLIGLELLINKHICLTQQISNLDYFNYGKGHQLAFAVLQEFLRTLDELATAKDINIFLVGHAVNEAQTTIAQDTFFRSVLYTTIKPPKENVSDWLKIWSDAMVYVDDYNMVTGGYTTDSLAADRTIGIYTEKRPGFEAGNRFNWPFWIDLNWELFEKVCLGDNIYG